MESRQIAAELAEKERQLAELQERFAQVRRTAEELRAANEALTFYLNRYQRIKNKFLPPGSWRENMARRLALPLLARRARAKAKSASTRARGSAAGGGAQGPAEEMIEPPADWQRAGEGPPVVIVIPNWDRKELLRNCIESILAKTEYRKFQICVYDQGSSDGSREYLESLSGPVDAILAPSNVGFIEANNFMIRRYPAWDVVFLNNDTLVTHGWLESLIETAYKSPKIGLVGSKLVYPDGRLQEAGSEMFQDGSARAYGKYEDQVDPRFNQLREVDYCSAACLFAKREALNQIGGFDPRYSPAYYEDCDLAFSARAAGFKVLYEPKSVVVHLEYSTSGGSAFERMETNRKKFVEKWGPALARQKRNLWEAVSIGNRKKVLVVDNIVPAPDRSAGGGRLYQLLLLLARHYHVVLAYTGTYALREYVTPLEKLGITVFYPGYAKAVHNHDLDLAAVLMNNDFPYIFMELYGMGEQYLNLVREYSPQSQVIVDTYDVHFLRELRESAILKDPALERKANDTRRREMGVYSRADLVLTVTEEDKRALLREDANLRIEVIPTIHPVAPHVAARRTRQDLLFVGGFSHTPNVDAVLYFCEEIFPLVQTQLPQVKVHIVGNAPPPEVIALANDSIVVDGYVPDLVPYLESAMVSIAPLRYGSGMKGKIAEAMSYGLPVVTTAIGAEGMHLQDGVDALIADDARDFADKIVQLHHDARLWETISREGRAHVQQKWSPDAVDGDLLRSLESLMEPQQKAFSG